MSDEEGGGGLFPLTLLLFSVGGVRFACCADQVRATRTFAQDSFAPAEAPLWLHKALEFPDDPLYTEPKAILTTAQGGPGHGVVIDAMEEIIEADSCEIRPFPALVEPIARRRGMWGVLPRNGRMYILLDLERLANTQPDMPGQTGGGARSDT